MNEKKGVTAIALGMMHPGVKVYLPEKTGITIVGLRALRDDPNVVTRKQNERLVIFDKHGETIVCVGEDKSSDSEFRPKDLRHETLTQAIARVERNFDNAEHMLSIIKIGDGSYDLSFYAVSTSAIAEHEQAEQYMQEITSKVMKKVA